MQLPSLPRMPTDPLCFCMHISHVLPQKGSVSPFPAAWHEFAAMMNLPKEWSRASVLVRRALPREGRRVQTPAARTFCAGSGCGSAELTRRAHGTQRATRTLSHVTQGRGEEQAIEERVFEREIKAAAPEQDDFLGGDGHGGQPRLLARAPLAGGCPLAAQSSARLQHPPREDRTTARAPHRAPRPSNVLSQQGQKRKLVRIIVNLAHLSLCSAQSCGQPE